MLDDEVAEGWHFRVLSWFNLPEPMNCSAYAKHSDGRFMVQDSMTKESAAWLVSVWTTDPEHFWEVNNA